MINNTLKLKCWIFQPSEKTYFIIIIIINIFKKTDNCLIVQGVSIYFWVSSKFSTRVEDEISFFCPIKFNLCL